MRILLIGNFAPPYEDEGLYNLSLLKMLREEGNDCCVINISANPSKEKEFINSKKNFNFVFKLIRYGFKKDVIHFLTKGYTRPGLIKLAVSTLFGRLFRAKPIITIYSELFSITGQMRSRHLGKPVLRLSFSLAHKVISGDKNTYETAATFKTRNNFEFIPPFIFIPEYAKDNEPLSFKKLENKKRVIFFSNVGYPSFLFEILNNFVAEYLDSDIGIAVSFSDENSEKLQHVIEETGKSLAENLVFVEHDDMQMLSTAYARADLILRSLSCEGRIFFPDFTVSLKKPVRSENYLCFPTSMLLVKEGEMTGLCSYIISDVLKEKTEEPSARAEKDFYAMIKEIYSK